MAGVCLQGWHVASALAADSICLAHLGALLKAFGYSCVLCAVFVVEAPCTMAGWCNLICSPRSWLYVVDINALGLSGQLHNTNMQLHGQRCSCCSSVTHIWAGCGRRLEHTCISSLHHHQVHMDTDGEDVATLSVLCLCLLQKGGISLSVSLLCGSYVGSCCVGSIVLVSAWR